MTFALLGTEAFAYRMVAEDDCTDLDMRGEVPLIMRNQGEVNWCYAYAGADLLQITQGLSEPISAADIAIQYNLRRWPRLLQKVSGSKVPMTGFIRDAVWDALDSGYCPERIFPSDQWEKVYLTGKQAGVSELKPLNDAIDDLFSLVNLSYIGALNSSKDLPFYYRFPKLSAEGFFRVIQNSSTYSVLNELRLAACEHDRKSFPKDVLGIEMNYRGPKVFKIINEQLSNGNPVTIDYFYGVLDKYDVIKRSVGELHTSVVLGRKFDLEAGECSYLIKNSYGSSCDEYDPRIKCEGGYLYVRESALFRALVSYEYMTGFTDKAFEPGFDSPETQ